MLWPDVVAVLMAVFLVNDGRSDDDDSSVVEWLVKRRGMIVRSPCVLFELHVIFSTERGSCSCWAYYHRYCSKITDNQRWGQFLLITFTLYINIRHVLSRQY